ncbi:hypothetical protein V1291_004946 [Nitrobacteraceae bacterium AZCC 1564]
MKLLKYAALSIVIVIGALVVVVGGWFYSCQGRMRDCYASYRSFTRGADTMSQRRLNSMHGGFTASASSVAFPIPLAGNGDGILVMDHDKDRPKLISTAGYTHWSPRFSPDGERLIFFRMAAGGRERELLSCEVSMWRCAILFRAPDAMMSAVDIGNGVVLFSMNTRRTNDPEDRRRFDVFAIRKGRDPVRLTNYEAYELHSLSVGGGKLVFGAAGRNFSTTGACQPDNHRDCDKSEIFALDFDPSMLAVNDGAGPLKPLFSVTGSSVNPIASSDGRRIAFLNTNRAGGTWRYNFAFGDLDGHVDGGLPVRGIYFSPGAFAGDELFVNELFEDRYRIYRLDLKLKRVGQLEIKHSPEEIATFEPITLSIEGPSTRAAGL